MPTAESGRASVAVRRGPVSVAVRGGPVSVAAGCVSGLGDGAGCGAGGPGYRAPCGAARVLESTGRLRARTVEAAGHGAACRAYAGADARADARYLLSH